MYEVDRDTCHVHGTPLSADPVGSVEQAVIDMEVVAKVIGANKLRRWCAACGKIHTAQSPIALPNSRYTIRVDVFISLLRTLGMPYGKIRAVLSAMLRIRVDENDLVRAVERVARHLGPLYNEFVQQVRKAGVVSVDETTWWINGKLAWLWDFVTNWTVVIAVDPSRGGEVPRRYLEGYDGVVCKDSYGGTNGIGSAEQVCLQHLAREVQRTLDYKNPGPEFTEIMAPMAFRMIRDAKNASELEDRGERLAVKRNLVRRVDRVCKKKWTDPHCKRFVKRYRRERSKMFTFLEVDGVNWHNNDGERPFRPSASIRKVTGGSRTIKGARSHVVMQSMDQTCKKRGLDFCGSIARYLAGGSTVRRIYPEEEAGEGGARRLAWPSLDGPSVGDLAAPPPPPPTGPGPPKAAPRQKRRRRRRAKAS